MMREASSRFVEVRGERHHVLTWGDPEASPLFLIHGWMDVGASFQFLVDALVGSWYCVAPDLRGFGRSAWQAQGYWFQDYIADLDALIRRFGRGEPARLVGHSLGGNVVMHYAGARPGRVSHVVSLEGFGVPEDQVGGAPAKLAAWLDALENPPAFRVYASLDAVADRLQKNNPRLARERALFLAPWWANQLPDGRAELASDPRHRLPFPTVYRMEEVFSVWRAITAPVLWIGASDSGLPRWLDRHPEGEGAVDGLAGIRHRLAAVPDGRLAIVEDAGHMLHHDQPGAVAALIESFLAA